jgi:RNA polymerase sigma-70 factor (ECF subfamily)
MNISSRESIGLTSLTLLARVKQSDPAAWQRLSQLYGPLVYHWSRRCGLTPEDAADVVQEVFGVLSQKFDSFRRERPEDTFRGWLWTVTRNKVRDHQRRSTGKAAASGGTEAYERLQQLADCDSEPWSKGDEQTAADQAVSQRALELLRTEFEAKTWQAFWRATVEGQTAAEIAQELGMTRHAVHQAKYRVLHRLRQELDGLW